MNRRQMLKGTSCGFGYLALAAMANAAAEKESANPLAPKKSHHAAKAKRVIFLCMDGGPSHVDMFDYKPKLKTDNGKTFKSGRGFGGAPTLLASQFAFKQFGQSGMWMSEQFSELGKHADSICMLNGMHTDIPNHPQAFVQMHTGSFQFPRPSMGAWTLYGLGTENANLPGFVTLNPPVQNGGSVNYGSSFLPAIYQATKIGAGGFGGDPNAVANIKNTRMKTDAQREQLDFIQSLNRTAAERDGGNAAIEGVIESYELAFRMQAQLPEVLDTSKETKATLDMYGIAAGGGGGGFGGPRPGGGDFGRRCLTARRLVEAGVRFVEVSMGGWDQHRNLKDDLERNCKAIDKPIAGLLEDLQKRDMLKDTLVLWGGEFGRTPYAQFGDGRDHNNKGFSMWMAGGGVKGGHVHGKTDEYGYEAVEDKMHIHDWHATILHLLGLDHEKLTYRYAGRDMRLTDVKGNVAKEVLA